MMEGERKKGGGAMSKSILRPLLFMVFVFAMVFLMQKHIQEQKDLKEQSTQMDPNSVIYSDVDSEESVTEKTESETKAIAPSEERSAEETIPVPAQEPTSESPQ